jgi:hypothetical protein
LPELPEPPTLLAAPVFAEPDVPESPVAGSVLPEPHATTTKQKKRPG